MSGIHSCIKINSDEKRGNLVAMLNGDVEKVESLLKQNNGKPLPVFDVTLGDDYYYFLRNLEFVRRLTNYHGHTSVN